jgi:hypothetical protein
MPLVNVRDFERDGNERNLDKPVNGAIGILDGFVLSDRWRLLPDWSPA